jgi:2-polyprenyl-6-methoxyphenol hydroxylase-like FAD-dependent oxidoreductase
LPRLLTDDSGRTHVLSIPPASDRARRVGGDARRRGRVLAPQFNDMVGLCAQPFLQPIYDLAKCRTWRSAGVALLGDAAFVARPHVGAGVAKAPMTRCARAERSTQR